MNADYHDYMEEVSGVPKRIRRRTAEELCQQSLEHPPGVEAWPRTDGLLHQGGGFLMQEIFTTCQRVTSEAQKRGHAAGPPLSLETNWDFTREADREAAKARVRKEKPYFLVLAFPCGPWSPLMRLNPASDLEERQAEGLVFTRFCIELGRHFLLENPLTATSWKTPDMIKFLDEHDLWIVGFDQCALGLRLLHKKPTQIVTSSAAVREALLDKKCSRDHQHQQVIGGSAVTQAAGLYPAALARLLVKAMGAVPSRWPASTTRKASPSYRGWGRRG